VENTARLDEDDQRLQSIVEQMGGVTQGRGKMAFWEKVCQERNKQELQKAGWKQQQVCPYVPNLHKNGKTTRMHYNRLTEKLDKRVSIAETQWPQPMTCVEVRSWEGIQAELTFQCQHGMNQ
jgi:hypothetical protein